MQKEKKEVKVWDEDRGKPVEFGGKVESLSWHKPKGLKQGNHVQPACEAGVYP